MAKQIKISKMQGLFKRWSVLSTVTIFLLLIGGCEKEDYTLPVDFSLYFTTSTDAILGGSVEIEEISFNLNSLDIQGYRELGDDVFLTRSFTQGKKFIIKPSLLNVYEKFDIPQGVYHPITFLLNFKPDYNETELINDILDCLEDYNESEDILVMQEELGDIIEDYLEYINPSILVKARFTFNNSTKNLLIVVNDPIKFQVIASNKNGGNEIALDKSITNSGRLVVDPSYWLSVITPTMLDDAYTGIIESDEYVFLSKYVNSNIYSAIFNRIEESTILVVNE